MFFMKQWEIFLAKEGKSHYEDRAHIESQSLRRTK